MTTTNNTSPDFFTGRPRTHRVAALSAPTAAQVKIVHVLLAAAVEKYVFEMELAGRGSRAEVHPAALAAMQAAIDGKPVGESTAKMVAHAIRCAGCRAAAEVLP